MCHPKAYKYGRSALNPRKLVLTLLLSLRLRLHHDLPNRRDSVEVGFNGTELPVNLLPVFAVI